MTSRCFLHFVASAAVLLLALGSNRSQAADPVIHVAWDGGGTPIPNVDYLVSTSPPASPEFPDLQLTRGKLDWRIWSTDTDNPGGVGDIGVISSPRSENFAIKLLDASDNAGARNVKSINLTPTSFAKYSNVVGGWISGELIDGLAVQAAGLGTGGEVTIHIGKVATWGFPFAIDKIIFMEIDRVEELWCNLRDPGIILVHELAGNMHLSELGGKVSV